MAGEFNTFMRLTVSSSRPLLASFKIIGTDLNYAASDTFILLKIKRRLERIYRGADIIIPKYYKKKNTHISRIMGNLILFGNYPLL